MACEFKATSKGMWVDLYGNLEVFEGVGNCQIGWYAWLGIELLLYVLVPGTSWYFRWKRRRQDCVSSSLRANCSSRRWVLFIDVLCFILQCLMITELSVLLVVAQPRSYLTRVHVCSLLSTQALKTLLILSFPAFTCCTARRFVEFLLSLYIPKFISQLYHILDDSLSHQQTWV